MIKRETIQASPVGDVVKEILLAIESAQVVSEDKLLGAWIEAVGEAGFKNTKPHALTKGTLTVMVKNSSWAQELTLKKRWIVKKLQVILGKEQIHDIRFKTGQI